MPITYSIDTNQRLLRSSFSDTIQADDFYGHIKNLRNDKSFQPNFAGLYDWQEVNNIAIDYTTMQSIASSCPWGKGSYRAIVVSKPLIFGLSRMYQGVSDKINGTIQVFQDMADAEFWLDSVRKH